MFTPCGLMHRRSYRIFSSSHLEVYGSRVTLFSFVLRPSFSTLMASVKNKAHFSCKQCHGGRPACARCLQKGRACKYDVEEGVTRQQDLYLRLRSIQEELAQMNELVHRLRHGSETYAIELLARLRIGEDVARLIGPGTQWLNRCVCFAEVYRLVV
jgi:hypothetical protein